MSRIASSTAHSSCGLIANPDILVSTSWPSAVTTIVPPTIGTRLTQTRTSTGPQLRIRSFCGSNSGVAPATATVTGYRLTRGTPRSSRAPGWACAAGR